MRTSRIVPPFLKEFLSDWSSLSMEDASDASSQLLSISSASVSVKEAPSRLYGEYEAFSDVYREHNQPLPQTVTGIKDSNSEGVST